MNKKLALILALLGFAFSVHSESDLLATDVASEFLSHQQKVLALAETSHDQRPIATFVAEMVKRLALEIDWVGLEISVDQQPILDQILDGEEPTDASKLSEADHLVLNAIRNSNEFRIGMPGFKERPPIRAIALDLSTGKFKNQSDWFYQRDQHMMATLEHATDGLKGRGLLYMGLAHLVKGSFNLPRIATAMLGPPPGNIKPFGVLLAERLTKSGILTIALHTESPWIEKWAMLPPDYRSFYKFLSNFDSPVLTSTQDESFQLEELRADKDHHFPTKLGTNIDFIAQIKQKFTMREQCKAILQNKASVARGLMIRFMDYKLQLFSP